MKRIDTIIFDFDGTLVKLKINFRLIRSKILKLMKKYGINLDRHRVFILELIDFGFDELKKQGIEKADRFKKEALDIVKKIELESAKKAEVINGVDTVISNLRMLGIKIGIVTRNGRKAVKHAISRLNLDYDTLTTRDDVKFVKPHPYHLHFTLKRLNSDSKYSIMVGDHPMDVIAGRRAGMKTIGVLSGDSTIEDFSIIKPDLILNSVKELKKVIHPEWNNWILKAKN